MQGAGASTLPGYGGQRGWVPEVRLFRTRGCQRAPLGWLRGWKASCRPPPGEYKARSRRNCRPNDHGAGISRRRGVGRDTWAELLQATGRVQTWQCSRRLLRLTPGRDTVEEETREIRRPPASPVPGSSGSLCAQ